MNPFKTSLFGLLCAVTAGAHAQDAEHEAWIRLSTRNAVGVFAASGAPGLRKAVLACYAGADKQADFKSFFLEAERCTSMDHLGLIVFMAQKAAHEVPGRPVNDSFFNPPAQQARVDGFWSNRQMDEAEKRELVEKIYAVVYDEATKSAPKFRAPPSSASPSTK